MTWYPTNANDVQLNISRVERDESGSRTGSTEVASTALVVVDEFNLDEEEDLEGLSGVGRRTPKGISKGDIEYSFDFTIQGEDAEVFEGIVDTDNENTAQELEIVALFEELEIELAGVWAGTRNVSASSGDPTEMEVEGMATEKRNIVSEE